MVYAPVAAGFTHAYRKDTIPRPRCHLIRYHGILGPAAKDRAKVVGTPVTPPAPNAAVTDKAGEGESRDIDSTKLASPSRLPWAVLLKRVFMTDVLTCPECQGRMTILAAITNPAAFPERVSRDVLPGAPRRSSLTTRSLAECARRGSHSTPVGPLNCGPTPRLSIALARTAIEGKPARRN
jgi:hypothetical protein